MKLCSCAKEKMVFVLTKEDSDEKIVNERYKESYVEETLSNGLHVVLWQKPDYQKSLFMMATPLGALDIEQVDSKGNNYRFPAGIAHFLEHKMFETKEGDIMEEFSKMGANVNAFTSYTETVYYSHVHLMLRNR